MGITQIMPQSGLQLLIIVGATFLLAGVYTGLGEFMLFLGISAWVIYNLLNFGRQF